MQKCKNTQYKLQFTLDKMNQILQHPENQQADSLASIFLNYVLSFLREKESNIQVDSLTVIFLRNVHCAYLQYIHDLVHTPLYRRIPKIQLPWWAAFSLSITDTLHGEDHNIFLQQTCPSPIIQLLVSHFFLSKFGCRIAICLWTTNHNRMLQYLLP